MTRRPDIDELIGRDVPEEERERLRRVHELLVQAGPPPELSPSLAQAPSPATSPRQEELRWLPQRRVGRTLTLAAGFAALALALGYLVGRQHGGLDVTQSVTMHGTQASPKAAAVVKVGERDENGNYPLEVKVTGLRPLPAKSYYVLYLVKGKRPAAICGSFLVRGDATTVRMSAPYDYHEYDGWTVAVYTIGHRKPGPTLLTT
jgi:hypothetical protein